MIARQICFLLLTVVPFLSSQEIFDITPGSGTVGIAFGRIPETDLMSRSGSYESRWFGINASVPLSRSISITEGEGTLQQFTLNGSLRRNTTEFSLLSGTRMISSGWLGGSWFIVTASKGVLSYFGKHRIYRRDRSGRN
jgi:hypothetical protein